MSSSRIYVMAVVSLLFTTQSHADTTVELDPGREVVRETMVCKESTDFGISLLPGFVSVKTGSFRRHLPVADIVQVDNFASLVVITFRPYEIKKEDELVMRCLSIRISDGAMPPARVMQILKDAARTTS